MIVDYVLTYIKLQRQFNLICNFYGKYMFVVVVPTFVCLFLKIIFKNYLLFANFQHPDQKTVPEYISITCADKMIAAWSHQLRFPEFEVILQTFTNFFLGQNLRITLYCIIDDD